ncbi:hypothetical protein AtEden1_Chr5g0127751 [Arabidopsis thaliana]
MVSRLKPIPDHSVLSQSFWYNQVSLVGLMCDKDVSKVTLVRFTLDDGTGQFDCKRW